MKVELRSRYQDNGVLPWCGVACQFRVLSNHFGQKILGLHLMPDAKTIFIVDDDAGMLDALSQTVAMMGERAECYTSPREFLAKADMTRGSCLVSDLKLPEMSGIQLFEEVRRLHRSLPLILVTGFGDIPTAVKAMKLGAITCLEKPFRPEEFISAIESAVATDVGPSQGTPDRKVLKALLRELNTSEYEVFRRIARGMSNREIAAELDVSIRTVQFRRSEIKQKLAIRTRADLLEVLNAFAVLESEAEPNTAAGSVARD